MKKWKRVIAIALLLCMTVSLMPPVQFAKAADVTQRYELDTDGIDVGATYLIVNTSSNGSAYVLRRNSTSFQRQQVTIATDDEGVVYINQGFSNESSSQMQFTNAASGRITNGRYNLSLSSSNGSFSTGTGSGTSLKFTHTGSGAYNIYYTSFRNYYLRYSSNKFSRGSSSAKVYLFKLTDYHEGFNVSYDGNGYTDGTLPETAESLKSGTEYTVLAPTDLRKEVGEDTYLFQCWNTMADGSGTNYVAGDKIAVTADTILYAQWYLQAKYTVSMVTNLNGKATDVSAISGKNTNFAVKRQEDGENGEFIPLTRTAEGTYTVRVAENGTYVVYSRVDEGAYSEVHGHMVVIYNQDGHTECSHYSVSYNVAGGQWAEGEEPTTGMYHANEAVVAHDKAPTLEGNRFLGWQDAEGKVYAPGAKITDAINGQIELTALWEETIDVTVNITIHHKAPGGGTNDDIDKDEVLLNFLKYENDANLPLEDIVLNDETKYDPATDTTTYTYVFKDLPKGHYHATATKAHYDISTEHSGEHDADQTIDITLTFAPSSFDLEFEVQIKDFANQSASLIPQAVNVKVTAWSYNGDVLGWYTISQQAGTGVPTTLTIDENGKGVGSYTVWKYWPDAETTPYVYRVEVTSFVLPDGTVVPAGGDGITYTIDGTGFYTATVSIEGTGKQPTYPAGSNTDLFGAYYTENGVVGKPVVTVDINPYTITFDAGEGTVNGQDKITLENQFRYPDLSDYTAVANDDKQFVGWVDAEGKPVSNMAGALLAGNTVYYARYRENIAISGTVYADATYQSMGQTANIYETDQVKTVLVVLQKKMGEHFNDVATMLVPLTYADGVGTGDYTFGDIANDGTEYRVQVHVYNFADTYDNNADGKFANDQAIAQISDLTTEAKVDIHLAFAPESYAQNFRVDASLIQEDLRPTDALVQILYRELEDVHHYKEISQHLVDPYGVKVNMDGATGTGSEDLWIYHTDGNLYEYQMQVYKLFGKNVAGAYDTDGEEYNQSRPYTIVYGASSTYAQDSTLVARLVPKEYAVKIDLNMGDDPNGEIYGMENFMIDDGTGNESYAFMHTWSFSERFTAYPFRPGYVFRGWTCENVDDVLIENGTVYIGKTLAHDVTVTANWEKLTGTDYMVRHLEKNTNEILSSAQLVSGSALGSKVVAAESTIEIEGYTYAGAAVGVDGAYVNKFDNPTMTVSDDPTKNVLVIYYLPDGSDGYTEQVESNLDLNKTAVLEDDGTYTITMDTFAKDNPITTQILNNTPMDVILVLDQSASLYQQLEYIKNPETGAWEIKYPLIEAREEAVTSFINLVAQHGKENEVDHRVAVVGFAGDERSGLTSSSYPLAGGTGYNWPNTGMFDSSGTFHHKGVVGYKYTPVEGAMDSSKTYYALDHDHYQLLTYYATYHHLITEDEARLEDAKGVAVYGFVEGLFVPLTRNSSGLWLYGDKQLYSSDLFFTYHEQVWTHRDGLERREIHGYTVNGVYEPVAGHDSAVYTREEVLASSTEVIDPQYYRSVYEDVLMPVSIGVNGSGRINPALENITEKLGANSQTYIQHGMEMANNIFEVHKDEEDRLRLIVVFTDGMPGSGPFNTTVANQAIAEAYKSKNTYGAQIYTVGLYNLTNMQDKTNQEGFMQALSSNYPQAQSMDDALNAGGATESSYYFVGSEANQLAPYFRDVFNDITTKINQEVVLHDDTILRDIMGQGLVLTPGTKITIYTQAGTYIDENQIHWSNEREYVTHVEIPENPKNEVYSDLNAEIDYTLDDGTVVKKSVPYISVYNLQAENATNPDGEDYHPHTVDVTGYNFKEWYISESNKEGKRMIVEITQIEATDDVQWGRATATNNDRSGLWLPADANGERQLLMPFDQPNTIFVERAYVLDYGKEFALADWYFDDAVGKEAMPIHLDLDITDGMNGFDENNPNVQNAIDGAFGNTKYGNVTLKNGQVVYEPTTMHWSGYDQFYVFGNTWRKTVLAQDANQNGNLWNKVTVIPANNIYYEDSFVTTEDSTVNGIDGFTFTGAWSIVTDGAVGDNVEQPEHLEKDPYGEVHGWTDALDADGKYTDGSAHITGLNDKEIGASVQFDFTGTGVDVYSTTNASSGMIIAILTHNAKKADGSANTHIEKTLAIDNLAVSGDYYHIPTLSFMNLEYGSYTLKIIATSASDAATGVRRFEYCIDGVRIYNPLGRTTNEVSEIVKDAYELEANPVFTEVRDILLDNNSFTADVEGLEGAVFIDKGEGEGNTAYDIGTFEKYGPKNEVYLAPGQAIAMCVDEANTYFVGLKSLDGTEVVANISGTDTNAAQIISLSHTTDMYYRVVPVDGYIVVQNGGESGILSLTKLRTTNTTKPATAGGILRTTSAEDALIAVEEFALRVERTLNTPPAEPEVQIPSADETVQQIVALTGELFSHVKSWLNS